MKDIKLRQAIENNHQELMRQLKKQKFIESATLIGKNPKERRIEPINDLDTVVILNKNPSPGEYQEIVRVFENLRNASNSQTDFCFDIADGPIKPLSEHENEVFYHVILHTKKTYKESPLTLVKNSWQYEKPLFGPPLSSIEKIPGVNRNELVHGTLGLEHSLQLIESSESGQLRWDMDSSEQMRMKFIPQTLKTNEEKLELSMYCILRAASNSLRYITGNQQIGIGQTMCKQFSSIFKYPLNSIPLKTYVHKRKLRNRNFPATNSITEHYQHLAHTFIGHLIKYV